MTIKICIISLYDVIRRDDGGAVRTYHLAESLASHGHNITVILPGRVDESVPNRIFKVKRIKGVIPRRLLAFLSYTMGVKNSDSMYVFDLAFLQKSLTEILSSDAVQMDMPVAAAVLVTFFLSKILRKKVVIDSHDAFQALRIRYSNELRRVLELLAEKIAYKCTRLVLTVSEHDKELLVKHGMRQDRIVVIPNGVDTAIWRPGESKESIKKQLRLSGFSVVIFLGNMEYLPNQEAVDLIARKIAPYVLNEIGNVRFIMVGRKPKKVPSGHGLIFTGVVSDVGHFLSASDVAIAPLLHGSGTRLKILEYLSKGVPVVSTSIGIEGLNVRNGFDVLIEDNMDVFSKRIIELLQDPWLRKCISEAGRDLVVKEYDWSRIGRKLNSTYELLGLSN